MNTENWVKVYDLSDDKLLIKNIQNATLNTKDYGLVPEIALFASKEWWSAIEDGRIPKREERGIISKVYMGGHNDFPEFELSSDNLKTKWERKGNDDLYKEGRELKLEYVNQKVKKDFGIGTNSKVVLKIYIKNATS